ncbi:MAG: hypothetical protein ACT4P7_04455 [Gemmatimonadaceae bacterium]
MGSVPGGAAREGLDRDARPSGGRSSGPYEKREDSTAHAPSAACTGPRCSAWVRSIPSCRRIPARNAALRLRAVRRGAVLRGLDDGSLPPRTERDRILRIARSANIPLQAGTTQGSTDGSAISPWGPPNVGLSWPGRYSHGPAEVLDLRDVAALARLVAAVAMER